MTFAGVSSRAGEAEGQMNEIAYEKAVDAIRRGRQVMVFVHSERRLRKRQRPSVKQRERRTPSLSLHPSREKERTVGFRALLAERERCWKEQR